MSNLLKVVGFRTTEGLYSKLKAITDARGEDVSDFIRRAVLKELATLNFLSQFENKALGVNLRLNPWEEVSGTYKALEICEDNLVLTLTTTPKDLHVTYPKESLEAQTLTEALKTIQPGKKVAIIKTDLPEKPIAIRTLTDTRVTGKNICQLLQCRQSIFSVTFKVVAFKFSLWLLGLRLRGWF